MKPAQVPDLMPKFVPSLQALTIMNIIGNAQIYLLYIPGEEKLPISLQKKIALYRAALNKKDLLDFDLTLQIINHPDVMEAALTALQEIRSVRNDMIKNFFEVAIIEGNMNALRFFINKGIKINQIKFSPFNHTPLDLAIENNQEEVERLLIQHGAQRTKK